MKVFKIRLYETTYLGAYIIAANDEEAARKLAEETPEVLIFTESASDPFEELDSETEDVSDSESVEEIVHIALAQAKRLEILKAHAEEVKP